MADDDDDEELSIDQHSARAIAVAWNSPSTTALSNLSTFVGETLDGDHEGDHFHHRDGDEMEHKAETPPKKLIPYQSVDFTVEFKTLKYREM